MAGDWIKMEKATARKPEILMLADILQIHPDHAFGLCFRFWSWCDDQLVDRHATGVTNVTLDMVIGHAGFSAALVKVGWLEARTGSLAVPNFDRHLSDSAKNRAQSGKRKEKQRANVTKESRNDRDKSVTREEKRRVKDIESKVGGDVVIPANMQTPEVSQYFATWMAHLAVQYPEKVPLENSPQMQMFWQEIARMGPEKFCASVEYSVGRGWSNLHEKEVRSNGGKTHGSTGVKGSSVDEQRRSMEAINKRLGLETQ